MIESLILASIMFIVSIRFIIPLIFFTGFLALVARQWRKDLSNILQRMRIGSRKGRCVDAAEALLSKTTMREEDLEEAFQMTLKRRSDKTVSLHDLGPLLTQITGLDDRLFLQRLARLLRVDATDIIIDIKRFKGLLSLIAQRLVFARSQRRAACAYRDEEDQLRLDGLINTKISASNIVDAARNFGFGKLPHRWQAILEHVSSLPREETPTDLSRIRPMLKNRRKALRAAGMNFGGAPLTTISDSPHDDEDRDDDSSDSEYSLEFEEDEISKSPSGRTLLSPENRIHKLLQKEQEVIADQHMEDAERVVSKLPKHLTCSLTLELMVHPVSAADGNNYEYTAIQSWLVTNRFSPLDPGFPLDASQLHENRSLKLLIEEIVASGTLDDELVTSYLQRKEVLDSMAQTTAKSEHWNLKDDSSSRGEASVVTSSNSNDDEDVEANARAVAAVDIDADDDAEFTLENFLRAIHVISRLRLKEEISKLRENSRKGVRGAYRAHAVHRVLDDGSEDFVLDDAGFRAACAELSMTWNYDTLDRVINYSPNISIAGSLLRALESQFEFVFVCILIGAEVTLKHIPGTWIAIYLVLEYLTRVVCYIVLASHSPWMFLSKKFNGWDTIATLFDLAYLYLVFCDASLQRQVDAFLTEQAKIASSSGLDVAARFVRMLRLSRFVALCLWGVRTAWSYICCCCRNGERNGRGEDSNNVVVAVPSFKIFRKYVSRMRQNRATVWPLSEYSACFRSLKSFDGSAIDVNELPAFLQGLGFDFQPSILRDVQDVVLNDIDADMVLFDDLIDALILLREHRIESKVLRVEGVESHRLRARRAIMAILARSTTTVALFLLELLSLLTGLIVNLFILTKGIVAEDQITSYTEATLLQFSLAIDAMPFGNVRWLLEKFVSSMFRLVDFAVKKLTLDIVFDENVTCQGAMSLLVLPIICLVTAVICVIFDSSLLSFISLAPTEYNHHVSYWTHYIIPSTAHARYGESLLVFGMFYLCSSLLKNVVQVTIASMLVSKVNINCEALSSFILLVELLPFSDTRLISHLIPVLSGLE